MNDATATVAAPHHPTVHLLPLNLGRLAAHTSEDGRFSLSAVNLRFQGDTFTAEATDTKHIVRVTGPTVADGASYPVERIPSLAHAPNGAAGAMIPGAAWTKIYSAAAKLKLDRKHVRRELKAVACVTGDNVTTFGAAGPDGSTCETTDNIAGEFPPADEILSRAAREFEDAKPNRETFDALLAAGKVDAAFEYASAAPMEFAVGAKMLAGVLRTAQDFANDESGTHRVVFRVHNAIRGFTVHAANSQGHEFTALIMPLSDRK